MMDVPLRAYRVESCQPPTGRQELPEDWDSFVSTLTPTGPAARKRETVWTLAKGDRRVSCDLVFHGESFGWEFSSSQTAISPTADDLA